jgi:hypothetical protein
VISDHKVSKSFSRLSFADQRCLSRVPSWDLCVHDCHNGKRRSIKEKQKCRPRSNAVNRGYALVPHHALRREPTFVAHD